MYANGVASTTSYNKGVNNQPLAIAANNGFIDTGSNNSISNISSSSSSSSSNSSNSRPGMVATDTAAIAAVTAAAAAAAAAATTTATNSTTLGANSTSGIGADGPLVAPRPVPAHQLNPPSWLFAALPLDVLFGLAAAPNHKQKIINDV
ncbi:hypothetical protein H4S06_006346, partial [Coemansia sp. BCRC 34490]